jgi:hypothetical protein
MSTIDDNLQEIFGLLDIQGQERERVEYRARLDLSEGNISEDLGSVHNAVVRYIEEREAPYQENQGLRIDDIDPDKPRIEIVSDYHERRSDGQEIPLEYASLVEEARDLLGDSDLEVLLLGNAGELPQIEGRLQALKERKAEYGFVIPPGRVVKRLSFDRNNDLQIELGRRPKGYDPREIKEEHFKDLTVAQIAKFDSGLANKLRALNELAERGMTYVPLTRGADPKAHYLNHYKDLPRGCLRVTDRRLYNALEASGDLDKIVPFSEKSRDSQRKERVPQVAKPAKPKREPCARIREDLVGRLVLERLGKRNRDLTHLDPEEVYQTDYSEYGLTQRELRLVEPDLHRALSDQGTIAQIPLTLPSGTVVEPSTQFVDLKREKAEKENAQREIARRNREKPQAPYEPTFLLEIA